MNSPVENKAMPFTLVPLLMSLTIFFTSCGNSQSPEIAVDDWPQWRGPRGDGISLESDWNPILENGKGELWAAKVGLGYSNVAIYDGRLYTMGKIGLNTSVQCMDADTGKIIWDYQLFLEREPNSTPCIDEGNVYCLSRGGILLCLDADRGDLIWEKNLRSDFGVQEATNGGWATSPVVEGELLLVNADTVGLAIDKSNGEEVWRVTDTRARAGSTRSWGSYATALVKEIGGKKRVIYLGPKTLQVVDFDSGKLKWSFVHGDFWHPTADPLIVDNTVFLSLPEFCLLLRLAKSGTETIWKKRILTSATQSAVTIGGYIYGSHTPFTMVTTWGPVLRKPAPFRCVDVATGAVVWEQEGMVSASVTAAGDKLIILEFNGTLRIAEATHTSYNELSLIKLRPEVKTMVFPTPPVLYRGKIYCRNHSGDLFCLDASV